MEAEGAFGRYKGVANVGTRPTLGGRKGAWRCTFWASPGSFTGRRCGCASSSVSGRKGASLLEALRAQIAEDVAEARAYFGL